MDAVTTDQNGQNYESVFGFDQDLDLFGDTQIQADLLSTDFLPSEAQYGTGGGSNQQTIPDQQSDPKRVVSNRKAQQRFRQRQKARKASEASELHYLRQRVQELEQLVSDRPASQGDLAVQAAPQVCFADHHQKVYAAP